MPSQNRLPSDETLKILAADYENDEVLKNVLDTIRKRPLAMMQHKSRSNNSLKGLAKIAAEQLANPDGPSV
ncbi:hypothetical protein N9E51_01815, partial [Alphaproteobacteria bacterium]|nr:hypothetical protein [Alphaproteobacteria bacterium]